MKSCIVLILILITGALQLRAQSHFILAGQDTGLMYTKYNSPENIYEYHAYQSANSYFDASSIDINNDGINDVELVFDFINIDPYSDYINFSIAPLQQGVQFISDSCTDSLLSDDCYGLSFPCVKALKLDDSINNSYLLWSDSSILVHYMSWGAYQCNVAASLDSNFFIGGRLITASDTLFFYIDIQVGYVIPIMNYPYYYAEIIDYAIEGRDTIIAITSIKNISVEQLIHAYPNPFSNQINFTSSKPLEFTICDYLGQTIKSGTANNMIRTDELIPGMYVLVLKDEENYSTMRIVKK